MPHSGCESNGMLRLYCRISNARRRCGSRFPPRTVDRSAHYRDGRAGNVLNGIALGAPRVGDPPLAFGDWPPQSIEFSWREQDRMIHETLSRSEADRFMSLVAWSHEVADAGSCDHTASVCSVACRKSGQSISTRSMTADVITSGSALTARCSAIPSLGDQAMRRQTCSFPSGTFAMAAISNQF